MKKYFTPLLIALLLFLSTKHADAAPVIQVVNEASLPRLSSDGNPTTKRSLLMNPEAVSRRDCDDDQRIRFTLQLAGFEANAVVQAWVSTTGQSCGFATARSGQAPACWRAVPSDIPLQPTVNVDIPVRDLLSGVPPFSPSSPVNDKSVCGKVDRTNLSVHFLYFAPGNTATAEVMKLVQVEVDTVGPTPRPSAPSDVARTGNPKTVQVISSDASKPDEALRVFCKPINTNEVAACSPQTVFGLLGGTTLANVVPDDAFAAQFGCGNDAALFGTSVQDATRDDFEKSGGSFAFSVAKVDALGNFSNLSDPKCVTLGEPPAVTDPGDDDSGGCTLSPHASSSPPYWTFLVLLAVFAARTARGSSAARPSSSRPS